jgi:hypothetical protein
MLRSVPAGSRGGANALVLSDDEHTQPPGLLDHFGIRDAS